MMATTKANLRNQIAKELRRKGQGQTLDPETTVDIDLEIDQTHDFLAEKNMNYWGDLTDMPLSAQKQFVSIVAANLAESKVADPNVIQRLSANGRGAFADLNKQAFSGSTGQRVRADYF